MENEKEKAVEPIAIDVNCNEFYNKVQDEIESDLARLKKNLEIVKDLRISAAEMEVETAALYHAELLQNIEKLEAVNKNYQEDVLKDKTTDLASSL